MKPLIYLSFIGFLILISTAGFSQPFPPAASSSGAFFDSLSTVLLACGAGYGIFKFRTNKDR